MDMPVPKSRAGVLAAVLLSVFFFLTYYAFGFSWLLRVYENQFEKINYNKGACLGVDVLVRAPKSVYSDGRQFVYVSAINKSPHEFRDVAVQFLVTKENRNFLLLPSFFAENVFDDVVEVKSLPPGFEVTGRLLLLTKGKFNLDDAKLKISCNQVLPPIATGTPPPQAQPRYAFDAGYKTPSGNSPIKSVFLEPFLHSVLENVLLPPWSNGVIPALVVLSCWLFEREKPKKDKTDAEKNQPTEGDTATPKPKAEDEKSSFYRILASGFGLNVFTWFIFYIAVQSVWTFVLAALAFIIVMMWLIPRILPD